MRHALAVLLLALGCAADPVLLPDATPVDTGPCANACGPGTVCAGGACVPIDAGALDAPALDSGADVAGATDAAPVVDALDVVALDAAGDAGADSEAADAGSDAGFDVGFDAGPFDALPAGCASTTVGNCCGVACPTPARGTAFCGGGRCGVASCDANYGDCDGAATNGCETDLRATAAHCGACGAACAAGRACVGGACVMCAVTLSVCDGACVDVSSSATNCGTCGRACPERPLGTRTCTRGTCGFTCGVRFLDCNNTAGDGCEADVVNDTGNCGRCGNRCSFPLRCRDSRCTS